jgi:hypothetical protein
MTVVTSPVDEEMRDLVTKDLGEQQRPPAP